MDFLVPEMQSYHLDMGSLSGAGEVKPAEHFQELYGRAGQVSHSSLAQLSAPSLFTPSRGPALAEKHSSRCIVPDDSVFHRRFGTTCRFDARDRSRCIHMHLDMLCQILYVVTFTNPRGAGRADRAHAVPGQAACHVDTHPSKVGDSLCRPEHQSFVCTFSCLRFRNV